MVPTGGLGGICPIGRTGEMGMTGVGITGAGITVVDWFTPSACFGNNIDGCSAGSCGEESGKVLGLGTGATGLGIEDVGGIGLTGGIVGEV